MELLLRCECAAGFSWQGAVSWCMRINWDRLPRLIAPLTVAASIAAFLVIELELARAWAVPIGLFVAVQLQHQRLV